MDVKSFFILICFCLLIAFFNPFVEGDAPFGICADPICSVPISKGITILRYSSPDDNRVSVEPNEEVLIFVKEYGPKKDLWGVIVRGTKGYISKGFIRETNLFKKELVPASYEFRSSMLVTDSLAVSSHLHVSSPFPESPVPQSIQDSYTVHHDLMSSAPSNNLMHQDISQSMHYSIQQQQQDFMNSVPDSIQQQRNDFISPTFSGTQQQQYNSFEQKLHGFMNSIPENIQQQRNDFMSPTFSGIQQQHNSYSESVQESPYNIQPNHHVHNDPHSQFPQSTVYNVPHQSSHFYSDSGNILPSSHSMEIQSQNVLPTPTHPADMNHPTNQYPPNHNFHSSFSGSSINNMPDLSIAQSGQFDPSLGFGSQGVHGPNQHQYSSQEQQYRSPNVQETHSSFHSRNFEEDDMSKTLAMLSNMGIDNPGMLADTEPQTQSSQNQQTGFGVTGAHYDTISSQSQYLPIQNTDTMLHSSNSHIGQHSQVPSSDIPQENKYMQQPPFQSVDSVVQPSVGTGFDEKSVSNSANIQESSSIILKPSEGNAVKEEEILAEGENLEKDDDELAEGEVDDEDSEGDDEDENNDTDVSDADDVDPSSEKADSPETVLNMHPSKNSSQTVEHISSKNPDIQSSLEDIASTSDNTLISTDEKSKFPEDAYGSNSDITETQAAQQIKASESLNIAKSHTLESVDSISNVISGVKDNSEMLDDKRNIIKEEVIPKTDVFSDRNNNNDVLTTENILFNKEHTTPKISDILVESEKISEVDKIVAGIDIDGFGENLETYQVRNLKGEFGGIEEPQSDSDGVTDENNTQFESDSNRSLGNWFDALKAFVDSVMSWIPEPLYSALMNLQYKGISPRVPVFTALCGFTCIFLIVPLFYIKGTSKESKLSAQLAEVEKNAYTLSATNIVLEEKLESVHSELATLQASLAEERSLFENLKTEFENQADELENVKAELESCLEVIDALKDKENEYLTLINDHEKVKERYAEHKDSLDKIMKDQENSITDLTNQLQESEDKVLELEREKEQFLLMKTDYEEKLAHFDQSCNQLLREAEVWNLRVNELTKEVEAERTIKEELTSALTNKDEEIESLKELIETFKLFDEIEDPEEQAKSKEEKLQSLLNSMMLSNQLKKEEEKSKILDEQLEKEKNKILDMEVELLEAKSEIDKLKLSYNQALQDKAEAQTKLEVLTNYFKDKEIQLQRQLGAQEAVRQKKEEDANSAERRICLIEQENASYKSQVASMKQEMEETERTLKSQIAAQEKKAHENWIAARAAERNLENMKQEVTQLRQRLTLLEREQENWNNASRDEILRPVPKRMHGANDEPGSQEMNTSERGMFPPHDRMPLPPMMLPPDRPLPPLPPPPIPPMFLPPPPPMERHFRPPWHMPPDHSSDYRTTPPEFIERVRRESTPPRGRQSTVADDSAAMHTSSPLTTDARDSRNSTPPHLLPDFHDVPPLPGRPFFPPPPGHPRFPMQPPYRRDGGPEPKRLDNPSEINSRGSQQPHPPPPEQWQHSRV